MKPISRDADDSSSEQQEGIEEELIALLPKLKAYALYLTKSGHFADDLLQLTSLRALSCEHQWQRGTRLDLWARAIMRSIWSNELRRIRRRREQELLDSDQNVDAGFERRMEAQLMISDIRRVCAKISDDDLDLVAQVYCDGRKYREMAEEMGLPIGTVLSRVHRIRKTIDRAKKKLV